MMEFNYRDENCQQRSKQSKAIGSVKGALAKEGLEVSNK